MRKRVKLTIAGGAIVVAAATVGAAAAASTAADGDDQPITGPALEQATKAALASTGGGRVTGTEVGDEESMYEVEVTLDDGNEVDVQLDEQFAVVGSETDAPGDDSKEGADSD